MLEKTLIFPNGFLWGSATSAYQVEGNNFNSDWWAWEKQRAKKYLANDEWDEKKAKNHLSQKASDFYHFYKKDIELAKKLNQNIHRLSIEWSRIEPREGEFNKKEIEHYQRVLEELKKKKIKVMLTLWHFTLPKWLSEIGGWENKKSIFYFERFTILVVKELGNLVDFWITINEPIVYLSQAYIISAWPPNKKKNPISALKILNNLIKAHKKAYSTIHQHQKNARVGIAKNNPYFEPYQKNNLFDILLTKITNYFWNNYFLKKINNFQDFIGLNYYFHSKIQFTFFNKKNLSSNTKNGKETSDINWEIYPKGIYYALLNLKKYHLPIYITENGLADAKDKKRAKFILEHLTWVYQAIKKNVNVRGYLYWSLIDNFEWEKGFCPRFGLIAIDYKTMERTIRPSAYVYAQICARNRINENSIKMYLKHA